MSILVNHRDGENVVCKEALSEHTLSSRTVIGHMLVIVKKSSGLGCRITISRATGKMNSHYQQKITAELGEVYG